MQIDRELVLHIAKLAHISLNEEEVNLFVRQLGEIIKYIEKLEEVQESAEPYHSTASQQIARADHLIPSLQVEEALRNAPEAVKQFFKVPRILP